MSGIQRLANGDEPHLPQPHGAADARQRTAPAVNLFGVPNTPGALVQISIELRWRHVGEIHLGRDGSLALPSLAAEPALYRLRFFDETGPKSAMIGEAPDLARRFAEFVEPAGAGKSAQQLHDILQAQLAGGKRVELDVVTSDRTLRIAGRAHPVDLADRGARRLLEQAARIAEGAAPVDEQD